MQRDALAKALREALLEVGCTPEWYVVEYNRTPDDGDAGGPRLVVDAELDLEKLTDRILELMNS